MRAAISHLKKADPKLRQVIETVGPYRQQFGEPTFEYLARAIVYQQLNGTAAATIYGRFQTACGRPGVVPQRVLRVGEERLRAAGLSKQKLSYLLDLAERTKRRELVFEGLSELPDEAVIEALTQVKGIGEWTAHMFLLFALRRPDILPVGDYGIRAAMKKLYGLPELPKPDEMRRIGAPWRPWSSVASWYLWRSLDAKNP